MIVASCFLFTAITASAGSRHNNILPMQKTVAVNDTPYIASVKICRTGIKDTPYLFIMAAPSTVYEETQRALYGERGTFKVSISFYAENGMLIRNEQYFIRKGDDVLAPKQ